jgi:hypothetical protein
MDENSDKREMKLSCGDSDAFLLYQLYVSGYHAELLLDRYCT